MRESAFPMKSKKPLRQFTKHDANKSRLDLLPAKAILFVGHQLAHGARLYAPGNWAKCPDPDRYIAAMLRHGVKHSGGEFIDRDNGLPHLAAVATNALFALELILNQCEDKPPMGNYFALVERKGDKRGVVRKRFKEYTPAFNYMEDHNLDPDKYVIKTVPAKVKVGATTKVH